MLFQSVSSLIEARSMSAAMQIGPVSIPSLVPEGTLDRLYVYAGGGAAIGVLCTFFAARVARWLTFDEHGEWKA